jgi:ubiquinone biosynthesis protein
MPSVLRVLLEVPVAVATTLVAVRLLGVRRSWAAITLAGVIGWVSGNLLQVGLNDWDWSAARLSLDTVSFSILFTMMAAVTLDLLAKPGTLARGEEAGLIVVSRPLRDLRRRVEPYARYREVISIARRNGLIPGLRSTSAGRAGSDNPAVALRKTLEQAGVVFVKVGQMASTRDDLLPADLREELSRLQSRVDPAPREVMQAQLEAELNGAVDQYFVEFDWNPIGAASIAHAYAARLPTGEPVIVKVQRPGMDQLVDRDTAALLHLARFFERRTPQGRRLHAGDIALEFTRALKRELDFEREAAETVELAAATDPAGGVRIPHVYRDLCRARVLVEERFDGRSVAHRERIADLGLKEVDLADRLVRTVIGHMLHDGHFHADPHPGNVLLLEDGALGLIDFGSTGRLNSAQRVALLDMTAAALSGDSAALRDGIERVAIVGPDVQDAALERALSQFIAENLRQGRSMGVDTLNDLIPLLAGFDIRLPPELTTVFRTLVLLDGTARTINPGYSLPDSLRRILDADGPAGRIGGGVRDQILQQILQELPRLRRLPAQIDRIATLSARGDLHTRVSLFSTERDTRVVTTLVNRLVLVVAGGLAGVASAVLLSIPASSSGSNGTSLTRVFGYLGLGFAAVLLLRVVAAVVRDGYG